MSITTATGTGNAYLATTTQGDGTGSDQTIFPIGLFSFEETVDSETVEAKKMVGGKLVTAEAGESSVTTTITLTTQILNSDTRPLMFGQKAKTFTAPTIEVLKEIELDAAGVIADALITVGNLEFIRVYKVGFGRLTPTATASAAPASAAEVQIDTTAGELVFFAGEAGETISYSIPTPAITTAKGYGGVGAKNVLGRLSFRCAVYGLSGELVEYRYYPALDPVGKPTQTLNGGIPELSLPYLAITPAGWSDPFEVIESDSIIYA